MATCTNKCLQLLLIMCIINVCVWVQVPKDSRREGVESLELQVVGGCLTLVLGSELLKNVTCSYPLSLLLTSLFCFLFTWDRVLLCSSGLLGTQRSTYLCFWVLGFKDCLSHCSIAIKRHHDQGNLQNETFNWSLQRIKFIIAMAKNVVAGRQVVMMLEQ